jgi:hypothetical protein
MNSLPACRLPACLEGSKPDCEPVYRGPAARELIHYRSDLATKRLPQRPTNRKSLPQNVWTTQDPLLQPSEKPATAVDSTGYFPPGAAAPSAAAAPAEAQPALIFCLTLRLLSTQAATAAAVAVAVTSIPQQPLVTHPTDPAATNAVAERAAAGLLDAMALPDAAMAVR